MFRKILIAVVPAAAVALMLCASDNSASQAFAKGVRGGEGHGRHEMHNRHDYRFYGRYFGCEYPTYACQYPVVCQTQLPVVAEPVAPVCTTCEPVYSYPTYWGYNHYRDYRHFREFHNRGMRGGRGRK